MPVKDGKLIPDYQLVDGFRVLSAFSDQAVRDTINHKPKPGDILLSTFPKCGTNWWQQILLVLFNDCKPLANPSDFLSKCPYLEMSGVDALDKQKGTRLAKIHLPYHLSPISAEAKYIFIVRNPKDCLVSFFHHSRTALYGFAQGSFDVYFDLFINGENDYGDYFDHILGWYEHRNDPNVLFLYYENMKNDIKTAIKQMATFLGPKYETLLENPDKMADLIHYSSFQYMKEHLKDDTSGFLDQFVKPDTDVNSIPLPSGLRNVIKYMINNKINGMSDLQFVRKGVVGDWKGHFTEDQNKRMNDKIEAKLKGTEMYDIWKSKGCL